MLKISQKNVVLTGFMAVGKSTVGRRLALKLKRPFVDLDQAIESRERARVEEIFNRKGEAHFRQAEKEALKHILRQDGQVVATGGGAIADAKILHLVKQRSVLICLTAPAKVLLQRSGSDNQQPLLRGEDRLKRIEELLNQRETVYSQSDLSIDTENLSPNQVVARIIEAILQGENKYPEAGIQKPDGRKRVISQR